MQFERGPLNPAGPFAFCGVSASSGQAERTSGPKGLSNGGAGLRRGLPPSQQEEYQHKPELDAVPLGDRGSLELAPRPRKSYTPPPIRQPRPTARGGGPPADRGVAGLCERSAVRELCGTLVFLQGSFAYRGSSGGSDEQEDQSGPAVGRLQQPAHPAQDHRRAHDRFRGGTVRGHPLRRRPRGRDHRPLRRARLRAGSRRAASLRTRRVENISGTVEAVLIFGAAAWIIYAAVHKLIDPQAVEMPGWGVAVMLVSALVNIFGSGRLFKVGKETDSVALQADAWHLRTDVYTSLGVMFGLLVIWIAGLIRPDLDLRWIDPVVAIAVALLILKAAWDLTREISAGPPRCEPAGEGRGFDQELRLEHLAAGAQLPTISARARPVRIGSSIFISWWTIRCQSPKTRIGGQCSRRHQGAAPSRGSTSIWSRATTPAKLRVPKGARWISRREGGRRRRRACISTD